MRIGFTAISARTCHPASVSFSRYVAFTRTAPSTGHASTVTSGAFTGLVPVGPVASRNSAALRSSSGAPGSSARRRSGPCLNTNRVCGPAVTRTVPVCRSTSSTANGPTGSGAPFAPPFGRGWRTTAVTVQSAAVEPGGSSTFHTGLLASVGLATTGCCVGPVSVEVAATRSTLTSAVDGATSFHSRAGPRNFTFAVDSTKPSVRTALTSISALCT